MSDIELQLIEAVRRDLAAFDAKLTARLDAMDARFDDKFTTIDGWFGRTERQIDALGRSLGGRLDETNNRLDSILALLEHFAYRDGGFDSRLRALEAEVFRREPP